MTHSRLLKAGDPLSLQVGHCDKGVLESLLRSDPLFGICIEETLEELHKCSFVLQLNRFPSIRVQLYLETKKMVVQFIDIQSHEITHELDHLLLPGHPGF